MKRTFDELREEYVQSAFSEEEADRDPIVQFGRWFDAAVAEGLPLANACALATASPAAVPSARMVLLKGFDQRGFVFFTNYDSRKGQEIASNPHATLLFWWTALERQVRIEGTVERASSKESDGYFAERPRGSNLSALASRQSEVVGSRKSLEDEVEAVAAHWDGKELERPGFWGGYRVIPSAIEFWQGRASRLHDRLRYHRDGQAWKIERLCP
ncbi:MAG: pyridoxamine 5'-phosphate oxidase [Deltaproteobacteria bacterium]|nr:pyridoxamine 5'-phosphate oxidase [Deltaproteobacteria bacterium]